MNPSEIAERAARDIHEATFQNLKAQGLNIKHLECESKIAKIKTIIERAIEESRGQRWIPVEEKLPEPGVRVLLAFLSYDNKFHCLETGHFAKGAKTHPLVWFSNDNYYDFDRVTHWKPLDAPPKGNENV